MPSSIDQVGSSGEYAQQTRATGSRTLGKNEFLKLLTTQLANQDPLSPTDNQAFIAQLAQFASVEQSEAANNRLDSLIVAQAANNQTAVANLVGKDIVFKTDSVSLPATGGTTISGELSANAAKVSVSITDENGKKIRSLTAFGQQAGTIELAWDGRDDAGNPVPAGKYKVQLTAADDKENPVGVTLRGRARATGVTFEAGVPELLIGGLKVKLSDVLQIAEPTLTTTTRS
ncbi:MAG: flagellar hook assembly protein FlgD [Myxococcota bacterium]